MRSQTGVPPLCSRAIECVRDHTLTVSHFGRGVKHLGVSQSDPAKLAWFCVFPCRDGTCQTDSMPDYTPVLARVLLGQQLKKHRNAKGLSLGAAAALTGISDSKLGRLERAANDAVKLPDIYACAFNYGLTTEQTNHLIELANGADSPGWYHDFDVDPAFAHFIEQEGAASAIHIFELELVAGLFQTESYLQVLRGKRPETKGDPDQGLRARRQKNVFRSGGPEIVYVTSEAALRRVVGGEQVMRDQVLHLIELDERDEVQVFVLPFSAGAHASMLGAYELMHFAGGIFPTTVYLESLHGSHYEESDTIVGYYEAAFEGTKSEAIEIKEFIRGHNELA